ncbi:MAG: TIGR01458 family HAD-type hydrolase [Hyphomicrobium sp.]
MTIAGVLLDLAGVVYQGRELLPGAHDAIGRLHAAGLPIRFITNTTRSTKQMILKDLQGLGLELSDSELFTPAQAARTWLTHHKCAASLLVHPALETEFAGLRTRDQPTVSAHAVVVGDAGEAFSFDGMNRAFRELITGAPLLALAKNRTFKDHDGQLSLDAGAFVEALEFASGKKAIVLGKPSAEFFEAALASMSCPPEKAVMVGDDAEADVAGALSAGLANALLVRTGKYRTGDDDRYYPRPTRTVADLAEAADWIIAQHR